MRHEITVLVNGCSETHTVEDNQTLLSFLRDTLDLTGAKEGCNEGECGACVVLLDHKAVNACLTLAVEAAGREVTTIEGLGAAGVLHPVQAALLQHSAVQCGYCTPGMILSAVALLKEQPDPTEADIRASLTGNLCRCTGYRQIIDAVTEAAGVLRAKADTQPHVSVQGGLPSGRVP